MFRRIVALLVLLGSVSAAPPTPQAPTVDVAWMPTNPIEGTLLQLSVQPPLGDSTSRIIAVDGSLLDEPLHFEPTRDGAFAALGPVPVDAPDSVGMNLTLRYESGPPEERVVWIPVGRGDFGVAWLSVDPRFVDQPGAALRARIDAERRAIRSVCIRSHRTPRLWQEPFVRPRDSRVTSGFAQRREYNGELRSRHMGLDLAGEIGAPVSSSNRGVVVLAGEFYYEGNMVLIDHGRGVLTAYLHLSEMTVAVGDTVERGQIIGAVGATGRVTGPHLHWIAKYGTTTVNPTSLLQLDSYASATRE